MEKCKKGQSEIEPLTIIEKEDVFFFTFKGYEDDDILGLKTMPRLINAAGICLCLQGELDLVINAQVYHLVAGDLCVVTPHTILQVSRFSDDFQGYTVAFNKEFFNSVNIPSSTSIYLNVKETPCVSLNEEEQKELLGLCENLKERDRRVDHPFRVEISELLMLALIYEIIAIYQRKKPISHQPYSRKHRLFLEFQKLIALHYKEERTLEFYADKLCITSRYLSSVSKEITGVTAADCITRVIILNARVLLTTTEMTISQIADELNFPNPSFFSKYFRKNTGITPKAYRAKGRSTG
ncbi:helix-turn-helix transcriptional regulator [Parabacteroides sp. PF5-6]|uniref:AraC family transcriptional regulator n=1 Tax=Parabacteroides sp. PF5-6 TaxID=1742403 RepID=UPI002404DEBC|nr:helix-turn-helix transcriptional regulator [Parabacteroides sp. PF5-6]MDF9830347.1 AraC family transcriptional activator of pobA [Parabacteroides sp. PF5-6]